MIWSTHLFTAPNAADRFVHKKSVQGRFSKLGRIGLRGTWELTHYFCDALCDGSSRSDYFALSEPFIYTLALLLFVCHTSALPAFEESN